jgi:hypothetical protein
MAPTGKTIVVAGKQILRSEIAESGRRRRQRNRFCGFNISVFVVVAFGTTLPAPSSSLLAILFVLLVVEFSSRDVAGIGRDSIVDLEHGRQEQ